MEQLDLPVSAWPAIPALRTYLVTFALLEVADLDAADNEGDELASAARALGLEDDPYRKTRPSDTHLRRLRRWRKAGGDFLRSEDSDAA